MDDFNLYAYVKNDPLNKTDRSGTDCVSNDKTGTTKCDVNVAGSRIPRQVTFTTPKGWTNFKTNARTSHTYDQVQPAGKGDKNYAARLQKGLQQSPTPGNGAATPEGKLVDVNIPGPWGRDEVKSYAMKTAQGDPFIVNVTQLSHTLHSGFVIRMVVPDGTGGFNILSYGEGNALKQLLPGAEAAAVHTWEDNASEIIRNAR